MTCVSSLGPRFAWGGVWLRVWQVSYSTLFLERHRRPANNWRPWGNLYETRMGEYFSVVITSKQILAQNKHTVAEIRTGDVVHVSKHAGRTHARKLVLKSKCIQSMPEYRQPHSNIVLFFFSSASSVSAMCVCVCVCLPINALLSFFPLLKVRVTCLSFNT